MADPVANPMLIGPKMYETFVYPYTKELTDYAHEKTGKKVSLHMCGKTYKIWGYLRQYKLNELSLDHVIHMERAVKELGGHIPIAGNVDPVDIILYGTEQQITDAVHDCIRTGIRSEKGFTITTGCGGSGNDTAKTEDKAESGSGSSESGEKVLDVWVPPLDDDTVNNWGGLMGDWEEENGCKVNITVIPWDKYEETYTTALNSGEGPDVGYMYNEMFPTYIDAGAVADMSGYVTDEDKDEYKYLENGFMMDGQYGWPLVTGVPFVLYYNEEILADLNGSVPETWEDFATVFGEGKAAFGVYRSSQTDGTVFAETYPDVKWDFATSLKNKEFGTFGATDCLTLMSAAEDQDLAMDLIKYVMTLTSPWKKCL